VFDLQGPVRIEQFQGLDQLLRQCLALNPEERLQRMQKVYLELKLLRVGARKPEASNAAQRTETVLRQEISRVEQNLAGRVDACDRSLDEIRRAQEMLRASLASVELGVSAVRDHAARLEAGLEENARTAGRVEEALSGQIANIEQQLQVHADSMEAVRTAMSQTDDLVERVVEAFDSLQASVLESSDAR
jgi:hypothetical protein